MIREMRQEDREDIITMVQLGDVIHRDDIIAFFNREGKALVYDDGQIKGLGLLSQGKPGSADLKIFIHPNFRRQGIGRRLWDALQPLSSEDVHRVITQYRVDQGDPSAFYLAHGFERWYRMHQMEYRGGKLPEPDIQLLPYTDDQFEGYTSLINDGFTRLREMGDFQPYRIYPDDAATDPALRERVLKSHEDGTYLFYKDGQLVGVTELVGCEIDTVTVAPAARGKGYGRQIMNFSINRILETGADSVSLHVLDFNDSARMLYESMGFRIVQTLEYARWHRQEDMLTQTASARC